MEAVGNILNRLLSDEYILYTKTRNYHWNVTGSGFDHLHKFFETRYQELDLTVDVVAERARPPPEQRGHAHRSSRRP